MGGGGPPETRGDGNAVARQRAGRGSGRHRGKGALSAPAGASAQAPPLPHGEVSLAEMPFSLLEAPIGRVCPLGRDFSLAKPSARARRRSGPAPLPACLQAWGRETEPRLDGCGWAWTEEGASLGVSNARGPPAQARHVQPALYTGISCHISFGVTDPYTVTVPSLLGGLEEGRLPVGGSFAGRTGVYQVLLEEKKGVLRGQQSGKVKRGRKT